MLWRRWLSRGVIDEFSRVEAIKGQRAANVLTAVKPRRAQAGAALSDCAPSEWTDVDTLFRTMRKAGHGPRIARSERALWKLYLEDPEYGSLGALLVSAERSLAAEFPPQAMSREVLRAIGSGERTFTNIARAAGGIAHTTLTRATDVLTEKRVVATELPLSLRPSRERRYRVADPYLRFWLAFLDPHMAEIERMRGDLTLSWIKEQWTSWRGRAVEPMVRESLARLLHDEFLPATSAIGGYWTRGNHVEIDLVGAPIGSR